MSNLNLRHTKEELLAAMEYLYSLDEDRDYVQSLEVIVNYIEDVTNIMIKQKQEIEQNNRTLRSLLDRIEEQIPKRPQDHKKKVK